MPDQGYMAARHLLGPMGQGAQGTTQAPPDPHLQLAQTQLSQPEKLRLQRLKHAEGTLQDQIANGELTPEEGAQLQGQLVSAMNPLTQRDAMVSAMQQNMASQAAVTAAHTAEALKQAGQVTAAQHLPNRVTHLQNPHTGIPTAFTTDHHGNATQLFPDSAGASSPQQSMTTNPDLVHQLYQMAELSLPPLGANPTQQHVTARNAALTSWVNNRMAMYSNHLSPASHGPPTAEQQFTAAVANQFLSDIGRHGGGGGLGAMMGGGGAPHFQFPSAQAPAVPPAPSATPAAQPQPSAALAALLALPPRAGGMPAGAGAVSGVNIPGQPPQGFSGPAAGTAQAYPWVQPGQSTAPSGSSSASSAASGASGGGGASHMMGMNGHQYAQLVGHLYDQASVGPNAIFPRPAAGAPAAEFTAWGQQVDNWVHGRLGQLGSAHAGQNPSSPGTTPNAIHSSNLAAVNGLAASVNTAFPTAGGGANATLNAQHTTHVQMLRELVEQNHGQPIASWPPLAQQQYNEIRARIDAGIAAGQEPTTQPPAAAAPPASPTLGPSTTMPPQQGDIGGMPIFPPPF